MSAAVVRPSAGLSGSSSYLSPRVPLAKLSHLKKIQD
jgi:hypothetical protein